MSILDKTQGKIANDIHFDTAVLKGVTQYLIVKIHIRISRKVTSSSEINKICGA